MIKIEYDHQRPMPEHIRELAEPLLERYKWMIPPWIHTFHVQYEHGEALAIAMNPEYLRLTLRIGHDFYVVTPEQRTRGIIHEFMHAYTSLQFMEFMDVLDEHSELSEGTHKTLERVMTQKMEMATEGLASLVLRLLESSDRNYDVTRGKGPKLEVRLDGSGAPNWGGPLMQDPRRQPSQQGLGGPQTMGSVVGLAAQCGCGTEDAGAEDMETLHQIENKILASVNKCKSPNKEPPYDTKLHGLRPPKVSDTVLSGLVSDLLKQTRQELERLNALDNPVADAIGMMLDTAGPSDLSLPGREE